MNRTPRHSARCTGYVCAPRSCQCRQSRWHRRGRTRQRCWQVAGAVVVTVFTAPVEFKKQKQTKKQNKKKKKKKKKNNNNNKKKKDSREISRARKVSTRKESSLFGHAHVLAPKASGPSLRVACVYSRAQGRCHGGPEQGSLSQMPLCVQIKAGVTKTKNKSNKEASVVEEGTHASNQSPPPRLNDRTNNHTNTQYTHRHTDTLCFFFVF